LTMTLVTIIDLASKVVFVLLIFPIPSDFLRVLVLLLSYVAKTLYFVICCFVCVST
jgi:hypothetical protein